MHNFVQRIMRGVIFCSVTIAITACAGFSDIGGRKQSADQPVTKSEQGLARIDAIRLRVAQNAAENGDHNTAIRFFESVRNSAPSHPAPLIGIAKAHTAAGNQREAIVAYRELLEFHPDHEEGLDGIGRALVLAGNYGEAIEYFNRSLANAPSAALYNRLGVAHDLMGDGEGAQRNYKAALKLDPEAISPRNNLALSLAISESYEDAIKQIERVAAHPQATKKHRQNMTFIYGMAGENDEALASLSENGLTRSEIARNRELFKRIRAHARAGNRAEILAYLRNGHELGEPTLADSDAELKDSATEIASTAPDLAGNPPSNDSAMKANSTPMPAKAAAVKTARPIRLIPKKPVRKQMTRVGKTVYRVQLAAYRTSKTAMRGVRILKSLIRDGATDLKVLVKNTRSRDKRGIDYRIRTPQVPNREMAGKICSKFKAAGHSDCLVILHNPQVWANVAQPNTLQVAKSSAPKKSAPNTPSTPGTKELAYRVQLASYRTESGATKGQAVLRKLLGDRNEKLEILVRKARRKDAKAFNYQIRSAAIQSRTEGSDLCESLKKVGHSSCLVIQHNDGAWSNLAASRGSYGESQKIAKASAKQGKSKPDLTKKAQGKKSSQEAAMAKIRKIAPPTKLVTKKQKISKKGDDPTFRVQLASYQTESGAAKGKAVLKKLLRKHKVDLDILVRRARDRGPSAYDYQIRTGPIKSLTEGADLCEVLKKVGHQSCLVVQHNDLLWKNLVKAGDRRKASRGKSRAHTKVVPPKKNKGADPVNLIIELPSADVSERGHHDHLGTAEIFADPAAPDRISTAEI